MPDLRGTGKSEGDIISFGWNERKDLMACFQYLKNKKYKKIAAHGYSLGAATIVYSLKEVKDFYFIILESSYDNLNNAFKNRVGHLQIPEFAYKPVKYFVEKRINATTEELQPEEYIKLSTCPVLIIA